MPTGAAGGLDEVFFAHQEEIDLCWRMKNLGYRIVYQPLSTVYHVGGGSLPQGNPRKTFLNFRNNLMMLYKNLPAHGTAMEDAFPLCARLGGGVV
jgi:GT2 family glycosyltransferase